MHKRTSLGHILYLIDELKVKGGTEKHLFELATGMAEAGFQVSVGALTDGPYAEEFKKDSRLNYFCLESPRIYDLRGLRAFARIVRYINSQNVTVVQSFHTAADLITPLAARLSFRSPKIFSSRRDLGYTKSKRHLQMQRIVNHLIDGVLANSQAVKQAVCDQEGYAPEKITVIHNGINLEPFERDDKKRQQQRALLGVDNKTILIGSVGNIRPVKGYDLLVEAAGIVCSQLPDVRFVHAGEGEQLADLQQRCEELGLQGRFTFKGSVKDIPAFLSGLDIYVQPSRSEGFSNAILEAMAAEISVIVTAVGGNPEVVKDNETGLLIPPDNSEKLAASIAHLVVNKEARVRMSVQAKNKIESEFKLLNMFQKYIATYSNT